MLETTKHAYEMIKSEDIAVKLCFDLLENNFDNSNVMILYN